MTEAAAHIFAIAAEELDRAKGDVFAATLAMAARIDADDHLFRLLMRPLLRQACGQAVSQVCRHRRRVIWHPPQRTRKETSDAVGGAARGVLMSFPLPGGKPIADAKFAEVQHASELYLRQGQDMIGKGRWLALVAQALQRRPNDLVRDVLTEQKLRKLRSQVEGLPAPARPKHPPEVETHA